MAQKPSTPVKVPSAVAGYTPATLDPDMRSQINSALLRDGHIARIHEALLHALNSDPSNWPTTVHSHALALLRSGDVSTYSALLRRVLEDVRADSPAASASASASASSANKNSGGKTPNGDAKGHNGTAQSPGLALPAAVVEEALRVTRESLEAVCEIDDGS